MISRLFSEKCIIKICKKLGYVFQPPVFISFLILCLVVFLPVVILVSRAAYQSGMWYKLGFFLLIYINIGQLLFVCVLLKYNRKENSEQDIFGEKSCELENERAKEKRFASIGEITGKVAHDLNNILTGIGTYPEVLMMDKTLDPKVMQGLEMIKDTGLNASATVRDLLTICQGVEAQKESIDINIVLENYISSHDFKKIKQDYNGVKIEIEKSPLVLNIKGSYLHIEKIIMNLFLFAAQQVAQNNNGRISIKTATKIFLDSSVYKYGRMIPGEYVLLSVSYNGSALLGNSILEKIIIDRNNIKPLFDPCFIQNEMGKSVTGLGLTIVWSAVQDHNGYIFLESDESGTRFDLLFPADQSQKSA